MNKTVLCFGDSNTWCYIPTNRGLRFPSNTRWPGVLQACLGQEYKVMASRADGVHIDAENHIKLGKHLCETISNTGA